jgi:hypothetical protein
MVSNEFSATCPDPAPSERLDEHVEPGLSVNVDLSGESVEVVFQAAARFVLGIEIEKRQRDFIGDELLRQMNHEARLSDASLSPFRESDSLLRLGCIV